MGSALISRLGLLIAMLLASSVLAEDERFLFVTFKGEATPLTEQIYFAVSKNGTDWESLKQGRPILTSHLGEKGVRDPYLLKSNDGKHFYILATDLSINLSHGDWGRATRAGSRALIIWESDDLIRWSPPRRVVVAAEDAGCTWAPEAVYDSVSKDYLVFWASLNASDNYNKFRIWACRTTDFKTFSKPFVYIEKPYPVIDTTIVEDKGKLYRFTKNEEAKMTTMEVSDKLMGPWSDVDAYSLAGLGGVEGPECFSLRPATATTPQQWCLIVDQYGSGRGYKAFVTDDLSSGRFEPIAEMKCPFPFRHGSVIRITDDVYKKLKDAYPATAAAK